MLVSGGSLVPSVLFIFFGAAPQLHERHWEIRDLGSPVQHVRGPGVVGSQPLIAPGNEFSYSSGCPLDTSMGSIHGTYQMVDSEGAQFDATISPFVLVNPLDLN